MADEYEGVPIKKLPPGKAYGADDLTRWSQRRLVGRAGTGSTETKATVVVCGKCKTERNILIPAYLTLKRVRKFARCECGGTMRAKRKYGY